MGVVKHKHRHIVNSGLTLLNHAGLLHEFWTYAFATACLTMDCLADDSPYEQFSARTQP